MEKHNSENDETLTKSKSPPDFDGIICFGGVDWWYHNRGHYDLQMMREFSKELPVLYVNSIGMRVPKLTEGAVLLQRIVRKISSLRRGLVIVRDRFAVQSPLMLPSKFGRRFLRWFLSFQVKRAAKKIGIKKPLVWIACPPALQVLDDLDPVALVYQRTDRFEEYPNVDPIVISKYDRELKRKADVTLYCSSLLFDEEKDQCQRALFADHGVDFKAFSEAGDSSGQTEPKTLREIPHPRVGYVGNLEPHRVDYKMLLEVAESLPHINFIVVGPSALADDWCTLPNVHQFGQQPYEEVANYMAACDVLIMPWNENEWIRACNPVKLKEYLAVGRPVVTTPFEELRNYKGFVNVASGAQQFAGEIQKAIENLPEAAALRKRVEQETWEMKAHLVNQSLTNLCTSNGRAKETDSR